MILRCVGENDPRIEFLGGGNLSGTMLVVEIEFIVVCTYVHVCTLGLKQYFNISIYCNTQFCNMEQ